MNELPKYSYRSSIKSGESDEWINTYLLRPIAGILVRGLYRTRVTPNQLTVAAICVGFVAAFLYAGSGPVPTLLAGLCVTGKDLLDSADGQLARAKQAYSRAGRFLDSIGDIAVNFAIFMAIGISLQHARQEPLLDVLAMAAFAGLTLRVSYHVFYHTSALHLHRTYAINRRSEEMTPEDRTEDATTRRLHAAYLALYGWQDNAMARLDAFCRRGLGNGAFTDQAWYCDTVGLRLSGLMGMGTELFLLTAFSVGNRLEWYLWVNVCGMNALWLATVVYRRFVLARRLSRSHS